ncbi:MAG: calcium-binding protein, partial [Cypionkella sp.]|nr:calcium-binding protein [Cypionkella sp.]
DTITAGTGANIVMGGVGADSITLGNTSVTQGASIVVGDHATLTFDPANGVATRIESTFSGLGGADTITVGNGAAIIVGGAYADVITAGNGNAVILGDEGVLIGFAAAAAVGKAPMTLSSVTTVVGTNGGDDIITTGLGSALILGGAGGDSIVTSAGAATGTAAGANIILGDHGRVVFANPQTGANLPTLVETLFSTSGGNDVITTGAGNDLIIGGTGADRISSSAGNNLLFGDHASISGTIEPTRFLQISAGYAIQSTFTGASHGGGADVINGGTGDDMIVGGQGADTIYGGAGDDDIIGGHYLTAAMATSVSATASSDGGDLIDGGAGHDVILGDSGSVIRSATDVRTR